MTDGVWVNADRSAVVEEGSTAAAFRIHKSEAAKLGLLKEAKAVEGPPETAAVAKPEETKAMSPKPKRVSAPKGK